MWVRYSKNPELVVNLAEEGLGIYGKCCQLCGHVLNTTIRNKYLYEGNIHIKHICIRICFDGVVIAAQRTATF